MNDAFIKCLTCGDIVKRPNVCSCPDPRYRKWTPYTPKKVGMGSHQSHDMKKEEWLTPPDIISKLPVFDLDVCSPMTRPFDTAKRHLTLEDDGLTSDWYGKVWCNPPYGKEAAIWLSKLADHNNGIALVFARTETVMFFDHIWNKASAILFIKGRLFFHHVDGTRAKSNSGAPSVLLAYGDDCAEDLKTCTIEGKFIDLRRENLLC